MISLFLNYYLSKSSSSVSEDVYIFDSLFYSKLKHINKENKSYEEASRWLDEDIFNEDFLIMPVCEENHWFLIIIGFVGDVI